MKKLVAITIICCLAVQIVIQLGIQGYYRLNKDYIAANLCENKDKPQLKCNGKCHLKKMMQKAEGEQKQNKNQAKAGAAEQMTTFVIPAQLQYTLHTYGNFLQHHSRYQYPVYSQLTADIFHPPPFAIVAS